MIAPDAPERTGLEQTPPSTVSLTLLDHVVLDNALCQYFAGTLESHGASGGLDGLLHIFWQVTPRASCNEAAPGGQS